MPIKRQVAANRTCRAKTKAGRPETNGMVRHSCRFQRCRASTEYDTVFMDCNPSFSLYTQIALATTDKIILPVMADDSSRRAIQNAFSLIYGLKLPSEIYASYAFATKLKEAHRPLPQVHLIAKNRITQYMGSASAYAAVLNAIQNDIATLMKSHPEIFSFNGTGTGFVDIRDFQTTGV